MSNEDDNRMTWAKARVARRMRKKGASIKYLANKFDMDWTDMRDLLAGKTWREQRDLVQESDEHATIEQAYRDLTRHEFATWIRMHVMPQSLLNSGRDRIALELGLSAQRIGQLFPELRRKGYIAVVRGTHPGKMSKILLLKRALLVGRNHFIRMS